MQIHIPSNTYDIISFNGQRQLCHLTCAGGRDLSNYTRMSTFQSRRLESCTVNWMTLIVKKGFLKSGAVQTLTVSTSIHWLRIEVTTWFWQETRRRWRMRKRTRKWCHDYLFLMSASKFKYYSPLTEVQKENHTLQIMKIVNHTPPYYD